MIRVFISHSSFDATVVVGLVDLLRAALPLPSADIRCTTVDGYRLPVGADTDDHLRREIVSVPVFIGLVSSSSIESAYVLFELGARWGTQQPLFPLLAPGTPASRLQGPLRGLNALSCSSASQLHQLVAEIGRALNLAPEPPSAYQRHIDAIIAMAPTATTAPASAPPTSPVAIAPSGPSSSSIASGVPAHVLASIRAAAQRQFPDNFGMQEFVQKREVEAYLRLNPPQAAT